MKNSNKSTLWIIAGILLSFLEPKTLHMVFNAKKYNILFGGTDHISETLGYAFGIIVYSFQAKFFGLIFFLLFIFFISYFLNKRLKHGSYDLKFLFSRISFFLFLLIWFIGIPDFFRGIY